MSLASALTITAIVLAFAIFAAVLAWADHQTRHLADH
jgi:multisubunit Na+/H+ antiporter MnhC subunit